MSRGGARATPLHFPRPLVSRRYRDGRLASIGGADEVMLGIIAKAMHILPKR